MYSACPSTNSICSCSQRSASQYQENIGHRPKVGRDADDQTVAVRCNQIQKVIAARLQIAMHEHLARLIDECVRLESRYQGQTVRFQ